MRVALTGGTGRVGRFVLEALLAAGHEVTLLGRRQPEPLPPGASFACWALGEPAPLEGADALVHAALDHLPGRYRGGEGADEAGFMRRNAEGTAALFAAAKAAGVGRAVFLSSRAVYGNYPPGTRLAEALPLRPDTAYGRAKADGEAALAALVGPGFAGAALRATGVYGPPDPDGTHKWADLFAAFRAGEALGPRIATEVHGADLAAAVRLLLEGGAQSGASNVSDIVLDRRDLLAAYAELAGIAGPLPPPGDRSGVSEAPADRLRALGWRPRGIAGIRPALAAIVAAERDAHA